MSMQFSSICFDTSIFDIGSSCLEDEKKKKKELSEGLKYLQFLIRYREKMRVRLHSIIVTLISRDRI